MKIVSSLNPSHHKVGRIEAKIIQINKYNVKNMELQQSETTRVETLYAGKFLRIDYDATKSLAYNIWLPETREMTEADFKHEISQWVQKAIVTGFTLTLANTLDFRFIISPKLQDWYNKTVTPPAFAAGVKKLAFLLPEGIFAQMSIENIFEEGYGEGAMNIRYFGNTVEAVTWLTQE
jgi:hypothetical protein